MTVYFDLSTIYSKYTFIDIIINYFNLYLDSQVTMAEWLRRWTWNPMGYSRVGSNPARDDNFYTIKIIIGLSIILYEIYFQQLLQKYFPILNLKNISE